MLPKDVASLPDGKIFKYIPYSANPSDSMPLKINLYWELRIHQQQFQEKHTTSIIKGVTDLDLHLDFGSDGELSLRMIVMGIRCQHNLKHPLFLSVDFNPYRNDITALYHRGNEAEAVRILAALPVFLEAKYNHKIWTWFSHDLKLELANTKWDPVQQCLVDESPDEDLHLRHSLYGLYGEQRALEDWEEVASLDVPVDPSAVTMDLSLLFNMAPRCEGGEGFDDNASMNTMKTGTSNATGVAAAARPDVIDVSEDDCPTATSSLTNGSAPPSGASSQGAGVPIDNG